MPRGFVASSTTIFPLTELVGVRSAGVTKSVGYDIIQTENKDNVGTYTVGLPGIPELVVIAGILFVLVGLPVAIAVLVILIAKRKNSD